ncbi:MAG: phosphoribosylformimino-5-aminoimidazole carboxamide ribotide isomerase [Lachnospiraceae bacterium]|jgi:phosphoribosylformimino-5-aminoimidazole carboxamide ribotide isomerase|nr:phosphoribosylformimino-5-aminoimidazole carboxamide ribotide isomerase [Lachnospiraceae bacterium]MCI6977074.1 phosphoribosylformimino-5-aminoimidazole carboxamide ribotide isomerase [Lachnospiraceae bacterium]MDD6579320.1 phosphoribosylformimino-5-aminoimidazole carboxamide ribotide isomerase [Lachnospiraceae bacterium]MDY3254796.1 phosphoribosylformimino-5-aminoimidazole carboxamide ribotide isomerase [Lachnospiraceae bacterium]MDY4428995.1 phosphoribosylformimino-5-aminoimidazole carboxa
MKFRPCIDIHNGHVVQIVGSSLRDENDSAQNNFVSEKDSAYYANLYKEHGLSGGHIIILNGKDSEYYEATKAEAVKALQTYKGGMQIGGGITDKNAEEYILAGASHIIVTSYVFSDGKICYNNLNRLNSAVGREHICLDVSCRMRNGKYYVVTDRWQKFTDVVLDENLIVSLSEYCDELLVHAVDVEGRKAGINATIAGILEKSPIPVTYAGGISSLDDIAKIRSIGNNKIDFTIGTALNIFGGDLDLMEVIRCTQ